MAFVELSNVTLCSLTTQSFPSASETCDLVRNTLTCGLFVNLINYLDIVFCGFGLPIISVYGLISALILAGLFSMLFMLTKYFFFPNLVTLIEFAPMTKFGFSYLFFGPSLLMPYYSSVWRSCGLHKENLSPLQFSKLVGDIMRHFLIGTMVLCMQGYRSDGVTLWSCITFVLIGMVYLLIVSNRKYLVNARDSGPSKDYFILEFRVLAILFAFGLVLLVIFVVSHTTFAREKPKKDAKTESFSDMESNDEILGSYPKQRIFTRRFIWWRTVNGNKRMRESHVVFRILMIPLFFVLAHIIPVISKERILIGWMKYINCLCLLVLPFLCLFYNPKAVDWFVLLVVCWVLSVLVFISTHSMRRPDYVWTYSLLGLGTSSLIMSLLSREIENLTWQYISLHYGVMPDLTALLYFGLGEMFSEAVVVKGLQQRKLWDASFGVVMSMVTYATFLAFPLLYYHDCYSPSCKIIITASTETGCHYMILILSTTLLHISMSGYEFRISLFFYLLALTIIYVIFQWMKHFNVVFPLSHLHNI